MNTSSDAFRTVAYRSGGLRAARRSTATASAEGPSLVQRRSTAAKDDARRIAGVEWQGSTLLFTSKYGTPVEPRTFNRAWDRRCLRAGVRKITVHDARRTCATLLVDLDVHPRIIMQVLRHAEVSVTMEIYSQASSDATREALKRLGESLR